MKLPFTTTVDLKCPSGSVIPAGETIVRWDVEEPAVNTSTPTSYGQAVARAARIVYSCGVRAECASGRVVRVLTHEQAREEHRVLMAEGEPRRDAPVGWPSGEKAVEAKPAETLVGPFPKPGETLAKMAASPNAGAKQFAIVTACGKFYAGVSSLDAAMHWLGGMRCGDRRNAFLYRVMEDRTLERIDFLDIRAQATAPYCEVPTPESDALKARVAELEADLARERDEKNKALARALAVEGDFSDRSEEKRSIEREQMDYLKRKLKWHEEGYEKMKGDNETLRATIVAQAVQIMETKKGAK